MRTSFQLLILLSLGLVALSRPVPTGDGTGEPETLTKQALEDAKAGIKSTWNAPTLPPRTEVTKPPDTTGAQRADAAADLIDGFASTIKDGDPEEVTNRFRKVTQVAIKDIMRPT